jgi:hypothetical protein
VRKQYSENYLVVAPTPLAHCRSKDLELRCSSQQPVALCSIRRIQEEHHPKNIQNGQLLQVELGSSQTHVYAFRINFARWENFPVQIVVRL